MTTKVFNRMIEGSVVNVLDYGADSSGLTDSSAALQLAVDAGSIIEFPSGVFRCDNLNISSNKVLKAYEGTTIKGWTDTERTIISDSASNIEFHNLRIEGAVETSYEGIGGGYVRFDNCTDILINNCKIGWNSWDSVNFTDCSEIRVLDSIFRYGKGTAITFNNSTKTYVRGCDFTKNGLFSVDDSYPTSIPVGFVSLGGRGITYFNGCDDGTTESCVFNDNSEYGLRVFGASVSDAGSSNINIFNNSFGDNGAPELDVTQGGSPITLPKKGTSLFVQRGGAPVAQFINVRGNTVRTTQDYGNPVVLGGDRVFFSNNIVRQETVLDLPSVFFFDLTNASLNSNRYYNGRATYLYGSADVTGITVRDDVSVSCEKGVQGFKGTARFVGCEFFGRSNSDSDFECFALSGSHTISVIGCYIRNFFRGIQLSGSTISAVFADNITEDCDIGYRNFNADNENIFQRDNQYDSQNPFEKSTVVYESINSRAAGISFAFTVPTDGYYRSGYIVYDSQPDTVVNNRRKIGWYRITTGTDHVVGTDWQEMWVEISSS